MPTPCELFVRPCRVGDVLGFDFWVGLEMRCRCGSVEQDVFSCLIVLTNIIHVFVFDYIGNLFR